MCVDAQNDGAKSEGTITDLPYVMENMATAP